ncbi:MAG TPA: QueT transporter family protein, partial [Atribacteraceae bacterium]|nr:QueT transporter family protein [Atribacteraceae bacterium]
MLLSIRAAMIAAIYVVLTVTPPLHSLSYGPVQVRVSEFLTVLPFVFPEAIWGVGIGCFLANLVGGVGWLDTVFGSALTL